MRRALLAICALLALGGCGDAYTASGTALYLRFELPSSPAVTQLQVSLSGPQGFAPAPLRVPEVAGPVLSSPQTVRLLLDDALDGELVSIEADGLANGRLLLQGSAAAAIVRGREVEAVLVLARP